MIAFFWVAYFFELLMIFSEQLQSLHHLGIGTATFLGWAALIMPNYLIYCRRINLATFSVGVPVLVWVSSRPH